jgi:DNA-binding LacI/PurR family transcriptional regulator
MATLGDVARHAGVSAASVSRALNLTRDLDFKPSVDEYPRFYTATRK